MADTIDVFEGNLGKRHEDGAQLKEFLEGERWGLLMGNIERSIKGRPFVFEMYPSVPLLTRFDFPTSGPFYFGDEPSSVDFFLAATLDWRMAHIFEPLRASKGPTLNEISIPES